MPSAVIKEGRKEGGGHHVAQQQNPGEYCQFIFAQAVHQPLAQLPPAEPPGTGDGRSLQLLQQLNVGPVGGNWRIRVMDAPGGYLN